MSRSTVDRALDAIREDRVRIVKANGRGVAMHVQGSRDPDTNRPRIYLAALYVDEDGRLAKSCTCDNALAHPLRPRCYHVKVCELLWSVPDVTP